MILSNGLNFVSRTFGERQFINNQEEVLSYFDEELINFLKSTCEKSILKGLKILAKQKIFNFKLYTEKYTSNGILKIYRKNFVYPKEYTNFAKGSSFRNKKRPEHSDLMKLKMLGIERGDAWRELKSKQNKSIDFKKKILENKGIDIFGLSDDHVISIYKKHISNELKSLKFKRTVLKNFIKNEKYSIADRLFLKDKNIDELNEQEVLDLHKIVKSITSHLAMKNNPNMGTTKFFKRGILKVFYCKNLDLINFRSSLEEKFILFLEKEKIFYEYESILIKKINGGIYIPDFYINFNGENYLIELKGFIRGKKGIEVEKEKIKSAFLFCNDEKMKYIYCRCNNENLPSTIEDLIEKMLVKNYEEFIKNTLKWE